MHLYYGIKSQVSIQEIFNTVKIRDLVEIHNAKVVRLSKIKYKE